MTDHYELATLEPRLDPDSAKEGEPLDCESNWHSMRRVGYDADCHAAIQGADREPEFRWFG